MKQHLLEYKIFNSENRIAFTLSIEGDSLVELLSKFHLQLTIETNKEIERLTRELKFKQMVDDDIPF